MSFDKNHQSPDKLVDARKRTTQVNLVVVIAVVLFFLIGGLVVWRVMRHPPQTPAEAVGKP